MPDSNPLYELMGGYYPGDPLPRRRPRFNPPDPKQFNTDEIIENYIRSLRKDLEKYNVSEQAKSMFIRDVEKTLVIQASPRSRAYDPIRSLELGDEEDVAGVQTKLDINPVKWVKNPGEMAKDTLKQFGKDLINWSDIDSHLEMNYMWDPLLDPSKRKDKETGKEVRPLPKAVAKAYGKHLKKDVETDFEPFQLVGTGSKKVKKVELIDIDGNPQNIKQVTDETDLFKKLAATHKKFTRKRQSSGSRNGAYNEFVEKSATAVAFELKQQLDDGHITDLDQVKAVESYLQRARINRLANNVMGTIDADIYLFKDDPKLNSDALKDMNNRGETLYGQGIGQRGVGALTTKLEVVALQKEDVGEAVKVWGSIFEDQKDKDGNITRAGALTKAQIMMEEADSHFRSLGSVAYSDFQRETQPLRDLIKDLEKYRNDTRDKIESFRQKYFDEATKTWKKIPVPERENLKLLKGRLDFIKERYSREGPIVGGLERMNRTLAEEHLLNGPILDVIMDTKTIKGSKSTLNLLAENTRTYVREDSYDLANMLADKGVAGIGADFAWSLVRKRLNGLTPAARVDEYLKKRHYFGLKYESEYGPGGEYEASAKKRWNKRLQRNNRFLNKQSIEVKDIGKVDIVGSFDLRLGLDLYERTQEDIGSDIFLNKEYFFSLINGRPAETGEDKFDNLLVYGNGLKEWLEKYKGKIGLEFDNEGNIIGNENNYKLLNGILNGDFDGLGLTEDEIKNFSNWSSGLKEWFGKYEDELGFEFDTDGNFLKGDNNHELLTAILNGGPEYMRMGPQYRQDFAYGYRFLYEEDDKKYRYILQRASGLKKWLKEHNDQLGLEFDADGNLLDTEENYKILTNLFDSIYKRDMDPRFIALTQKYAGRLDKFSQTLNRVQHKLYEIKWVKNVLAPISYLGNVMQKRGTENLMGFLKGSKLIDGLVNKLANSKAFQFVYKAISKLFGSALGAITGGAGKFLWAIIERAAHFVVKKVSETVTKFLESFKKGDIGIFSDFVEESASVIFRAVITCSGCMVIIFFLIMFPVVVMLSAITPVDPTRMAHGIDDPAGSGGGSGATEVCTTPGACNVVATVNCFEFLDSGWPSETHRELIENSADFLARNFGNYVDRLCEKGAIEIAWNPSVACGRAKMSTGNRIEFGDQKCYTYSTDNQDTFYWLFAHETGHIFHARKYGGKDVLIQARAEDCGNSLPTYVGTTDLQCRFDMHTSPGGQEEDFAEMVGNFVMFHKHCRVVDLPDLDRSTFFNIDGNNVSASWNSFCPNGFKGHYDFAYENLFGGGDSGAPLPTGAL